MAKLHDLFSGKGQQGQRPKRVGEEIRFALSTIFLRGESNSLELANMSITISEVRVSPDLKNATVFVMPLGGQNKPEMLAALKVAAPELRYIASKKIKVRYMPRLRFELDESFEEAERINKLLNKPEVAKDLQKQEDEDQD